MADQRTAPLFGFASTTRACVMGRFRVTAGQSGNPCIAAWVMVVIALLAPFGLHGQSQLPDGSAILQGFVRDSRGHPLAGASVCLQIEGGTSTLRAQTDSDGSYRFAALSPGGYTLRAEMLGYGEVIFGQLMLGPKETNRIDLTLSQKSSPPRSSLSGTPESGTPEFFDEPNFTVAGVTDPSNLGGHGADTVVRNKEALAKWACSLGRA